MIKQLLIALLLFIIVTTLIVTIIVCAIDEAIRHCKRRKLYRDCEAYREYLDMDEMICEEFRKELDK